MTDRAVTDVKGDEVRPAKEVIEIQEDEEKVEVNRVVEDLADFDRVKVNYDEQISARQFHVRNFRLSKGKMMKLRKSSRSVKMMHRSFSAFEKSWSECQEMRKTED